MPYIRRRRAPKRKAMKKRAVRRRKAPAKGALRIVRKLPEIFIRNSGVAGVPQNNDPTGTCVLLGTPVLDAVGGTYSVPFSMTFRMDQVLNSGDITTLCDSYKISRMNVKLSYQQSVATVNTPAVMPNITYITDHDDNVPPTINNLREKMGSRNVGFGFNRAVSMNVSPRIANTIFNNGVLSAYSTPNKPVWINSTYAGTEHYGIKGVLHQVNLATTASVLTAFKFDITATVFGKDFQ